ncbi:MAG: type II toxin-antitoxin system RelE/ParE family toxin [Candidatus Sericytochromatia bacterium]|nr:type II toxin-antitoxin system RelE/ParE family toxin [Candidatus Tanganyikabacteria bacterium]
MRLCWTQQARADLRQIGAFIAERNPAAARQWIERLRARARQAAQMPDSAAQLASPRARPQAPGRSVLGART